MLNIGVGSVFLRYFAAMANSFRHTLNRLPNAVRPLAFVAVIVLIGLLFPAEQQFKYQYQKQQRWRYTDLEAPFDFAILKTEEELRADREEVLAQTTLVFAIDDSIAAQRISDFKAQFDLQLSNVRASNTFVDVLRRPERYQTYGAALLGRIYQRGVLLLSASEAQLPKEQVITVLRGNTFQERTLENMLTQQTARDLVSDSLPYSQLREPEFLLTLLQDQIQANLFYSPERTEQVRQTALDQIVTARGLVQKGDLIISQNSIVTDELYQVLRSYERAYEEQVLSQRSLPSVFIGYLLLTALVVVLFALYLRRYAPLIYHKTTKLFFLLMWLLVFSYLVYFVENAVGLSSYLLPFCIVPITVKTFYNEELALYTHLVVVLIAGCLSSFGFEFAFLQILAGMVVVLSPFDTRDWSGFFQALAFIFLTYSIGYLGIALIREDSFWAIDWSVYGWLFMNAFLTLLAYPLIPLLERIFGFVSNITLMELSDMNRPLLRELALKAPGTLQHSLQVGHLGEAAARRIKADPLLVRVAALYHDIGKVTQARYFIENQDGQNPHQQLSPLESAKLIISHVEEGVKLAQKQGLPPVLIDFIRTHHGTTTTAYFLHQYQQQQPDGTANLTDFQYPGPRPRTREEAILMLADSVEAACKSLDHPTEEQLFGLIDKVINGKRDSGQLDHATLTFKELDMVRKEFKQMMRSVHHIRVAYPDEE
ncbi:MAG: HDIG domain-containing metalloprotein [Bacteroidota bacterium]